MKPVVAIVIGLALSATAFGAEGRPGEQALADMGLSGLQILTDSEAMTIRGAGFDGFATYRNSIKVFHRTVKQFHHAVKDFRKQVKKFDRKISKMKPHKPNGMKPHKPSGMKPPKMGHGGKLW